jgi:O-acetyl-ADP-ribose deacetylase (regulator of RNase III)
MRIPGKLPECSYNSYLAMRAVLIAIRELNIKSDDKISSVAIPSFCSGVGGMHYQESAKQMRQAYEMIVENNYRNIKHPALAPF